MKILPLMIFGLLVSGCASLPVAETEVLSGTELVANDDGSFDMVTYVTPEEYDRMTPRERERMKVGMGVSKTFTWKLGKKKKETKEKSVTEVLNEQE